MGERLINWKKKALGERAAAGKGDAHRQKAEAYCSNELRDRYCRSRHCDLDEGYRSVVVVSFGQRQWTNSDFQRLESGVWLPADQQ